MCAKCLDLSRWKCVCFSGCIFCSKTFKTTIQVGSGPFTSSYTPPLTSSSFIGFVSGSDDRVTIALEELQDLKGVWSELGKIWEKIEELREKPWLSVAPRKIRQALDALLQQLRAFPSRLKQYASFDYVQTLLKGYTKVRGEGRMSLCSILTFTGSIFVINALYICLIILMELIHK